MPILFSIGSVNIYTYGVFLVVGVLCGGYYMFVQVKKSGKNAEIVFDLIVFPLLAGLIASRLGYFLLYLSKDVSGLAESFKIWQGGMVSWVGFLFAILLLLFILKRYKEKTGFWLDLYAISALLGLAIGRLGSFISGEYAGVASNSFLAVKGVHPVTLYEFIILSLLFLFFVYLYARKYFKFDGDYFYSVLICYSLIRFLLDFLRTDQRYLLGLSLTQIISSLITLSIILLFFFKMAKRKGARNAR